MQQSEFQEVVEGPYSLFLLHPDGHEFRIFLVEMPNGRGYEITTDWRDRRPSNGSELIQAARIFARKHTMWA